MTDSAHSLYPNKRAPWAQVPKGWGVREPYRERGLIYGVRLSKVTQALMQSVAWQPVRDKKKKTSDTKTFAPLLPPLFLHQPQIAFIRVQPSGSRKLLTHQYSTTAEEVAPPAAEL